MARHARLTVLLVCAILVSLNSSVAADPAEPTVTFAALGDISSSAAASATLTAIGQQQPDLAIALGDLSYGPTGQEQAWCDFVTPRVGAGFPFELISGNHESNGENGNINDFSACLPNQLPGVIGTYGRQYYVDVPQSAPLVRFVMISPSLNFPDGTYNYTVGSPRYTWTAQTIDAARAAGIPWVVVGAHKPCISMGVYTCDLSPDLFNLLISKNVDLVLGGHEHMYQRAKQLGLSAGCPAVVPGTYNAACVVDAGATLVKGAGMVYATVGTGGTALRNAAVGDAEEPYFAAVSAADLNPTYGYLNVSATATQLSAVFVPTTGTFSDAFTITAGPPPPPNQLPAAEFASNCTYLSCTFDGTSSTDPDGSIIGYSWSWGDASAAGSGVTPAHNFTAAGTYPVTLTVTDNRGGTASVTHDVSPTNPPGPTYFARDDFTRTVSNGFGTATLGGAWSTTTNASVSNGSGAISLATGADRTTRLDGATAAAVDLRSTFWIDKPATGGGLFLGVIGRRVAGSGDYRATVRYSSTGSVVASIARMPNSGAEIVLAAATTVPGLTMAVGDKLAVRLQVLGTSPTTIQLRVWKEGTPEPTTWVRTATDSFAGLQVAGSTGLRAYLSGSATNAPIIVRVDDWLAAITP